MMTFAALTYGFLASFVLSAASHNRKVKRRHSAPLLYTGYLLCGISAGAALALGYLALSMSMTTTA